MTRGTYPSDEVERLMIRFPDGMRKRLEDRAKSNFRSMNGEVIAILAAALTGDTKTAPERGATRSEASPGA